MSIIHHSSNEIAHDARQSIATILTLVAAGQQEIQDSDLVLRRLDQVANQARSLAAMLDDTSASRERTFCVEARAETAAAMEALGAGYGGTLRLVSDGGTAWATFAPVALRRVLTNLIRNAMRAAGPDGVVQVSVARHPESVVIEVEDDGPGFGHLPVINGIGLRSARRLVSSAGGRIDTAVGTLGGALVRITLLAPIISGGAHDEDLAV
jgi:signal transduction histidine kinase